MNWDMGGDKALEGPVSVPEHAYAAIKAALLRGQIKSGDVLVQDEIAKKLGFSRVPVREALKRLEGEGFVVLRPRRGYVVVDLDADAIEDILDVRKELEGCAGYLATLRRTDDDVARARAHFEAHNALHQELSLNQAALPDRSLSTLNRKFHEAIFQPCGRPYLLKLLNQTNDLVAIYVSIGRSIAADPKQTLDDHKKILEAFARQDADAVQFHIGEHVDQTKQRLINKLRKSK